MASTLDFYSGNCRARLTALGWSCIDFDPSDIPDIPAGSVLLWEQDGHAAMATGNGMMLNCAEDKDGVQGDSSGKEICERKIYTDGAWTDSDGVHQIDYVLICPYSADDIAAGLSRGRWIANNDLWGYGTNDLRWKEFYRDCTSFCADMIRYMIDNNGETVHSTADEQPRYRILSDRWYAEMVGLTDTSNCGDDYAGVFGTPMRGFACDCTKYRSAYGALRWLSWIEEYNIKDYWNGYAGKNGEPLTGLEIADPSVHIQLHILDGDWLDVDCKGIGEVVDAVRCWR